MELLRSGLKLRQLQVFREVLRAGSTRRAATAMGLSQPAISQHLKQLEMTLGLALFDRTANRITPSRDAWELLRSVDAALTSLDQLGTSISEIKSEDKSWIAIAAPAVFGLITLPRVVEVIRAKTSCSVRSLSGSDERVRQYILSGQADLGISRLPLDARLFDWAPVATARNVCIFHPEHRFSARTHIVAQDLIGEAIIDIDPQFSTHQMNINALRFGGVEPDIAIEYDANGHEVGFVSAGLGVSITNEIIAREYAMFNVETRSFEPSALYHYVVVWQKGRVFSTALNTSLEALVHAFHQSCGEASLTNSGARLPDDPDADPLEDREPNGLHTPRHCICRELRHSE